MGGPSYVSTVNSSPAFHIPAEHHVCPASHFHLVTNIYLQCIVFTIIPVPDLPYLKFYNPFLTRLDCIPSIAYDTLENTV
ncbi:hypothetical protein FKM82_008871 [Ascaphus truei]